MPSQGVLAKQGKDTFHDNDFKRRWVEQYCASKTTRQQAFACSLLPARAGWRKTQLCSRCFAPSTNAAIHAWKVRLCSPCIAASILNKSAFALHRLRLHLHALTRLCAADSAKTFMLTPTDLAALPTWVSGVQTPFGGLVKFYFRRHLERASAQKHGATGVEAARQKQSERKEKRKEATVEKKQSKLADVDELLKANGLERGYDDLYRLGTGLAHAIRQFVDPKTAGKKSKRRGCVTCACVFCACSLTDGELLRSTGRKRPRRRARSPPSSRHPVRR